IVNNTYNNEIFFSNIGFVADTVIIDPDYWLITKNNTSEKVNDSISDKNVVQFFPNPFANDLYIYLHNFNATKAYLKLFDAKGSLLLNEVLPLTNSLYKEVNMQSIPKGIYIIKLQTGDGFKFVKKILKQ